MRADSRYAPVTVEKVAAIFTGRDAAISEPASAARQHPEAAGRYADLHHRHARAWARLWEHCHVGLSDNTVAVRVLRLRLVHLLQTISPHPADLDAGVPARGLHGEAYRGHVFWDSLFVSPVLSVRLPNVARSLLQYRYRRLPEARRAGHRGAMFLYRGQRLHLKISGRAGALTSEAKNTGAVLVAAARAHRRDRVRPAAG